MKSPYQQYKLQPPHYVLSGTGSQFLGLFMPNTIKHEIITNAATAAHAMPTARDCVGVSKGGPDGANGGKGHANPGMLVGHK